MAQQLSPPPPRLTAEEVRLIMAAAKAHRYAKRDRLLVWLAYRHALRSAELVQLQWSSVDLEIAQIIIERVRGGGRQIHAVEARSVQMLRAWAKHSITGTGPIFASERGPALSCRGVRRIFGQLTKTALGRPLPFYILRHSRGYELSEQGAGSLYIKKYLGHKTLSPAAMYAAQCQTTAPEDWQNRSNDHS